MATVSRLEGVGLDLDAVRQAEARIQSHVARPPLIVSTFLGDRIPGTLFLKLENLHPTGSFKVRPAFNNLLANLEAARSRGVVAASSGNFAQAVAMSCTALGVRSQIVVMKRTSLLKVERTRRFGGEIVFCDDSLASREETTKRLIAVNQGIFMHPFDSELTVAADGTIGIELHEQLDGEPFTVLVSIGGGGLLAGIALAVKSLSPKSEVIGLSPAGNLAMKLSVERGALTDIGSAQTMADALVASQPGQAGFPLVQKYVDDVVVIPEDAMPPAMSLLLNEQKLLVEPGAALPIAALMLGLVRPKHQRVVAVVSGGNVDPKGIPSTVPDS